MIICTAWVRITSWPSTSRPAAFLGPWSNSHGSTGKRLCCWLRETCFSDSGGCGSSRSSAGLPVSGGSSPT